MTQAPDLVATPNPTPADRLEAALKYYGQMLDTIQAVKRAGPCEFIAEKIDPHIERWEETRAHLAGLRRENTRTASASMEADKDCDFTVYKTDKGTYGVTPTYAPDLNRVPDVVQIWFLHKKPAPPTALATSVEKG